MIRFGCLDICVADKENPRSSCGQGIFPGNQPERNTVLFDTPKALAPSRGRFHSATGAGDPERILEKLVVTEVLFTIHG